MRETPSVVIHFHQPTPDERIKITFTTVGGANETAWLKLPFPLQTIPLVIRALNARQYGDWYHPFFYEGGDRTAIISQLRDHQLWEGDDDTGEIPSDVHVRLGRILGALLCADKTVAYSIDTLYQLAEHGGEIILKFDPAAFLLAALPWEVAHIDERPLFLTNRIVLDCSRVILFTDRLPPPRHSGEQLRVLTLAPHAGFSRPPFRAFEQQARQHLHAELDGLAVVIEHLSPVTMDDLRKRLDREPPVDVIDFYGHGRFQNGHGALLFDDQHGCEDWVDAQRVAMLPHLPRLFILHACQSAQVDTMDPLAGVATALSQAGVPAVVAMQLTIRATAATDVIVPTLYRKLASGWSIQRAVAAARQALYTAEAAGISWYLPAVYIRSQEAQPFRLIEAPQLPPNPFWDGRARGDPNQIIGRERDLQRLWERLCLGVNLTIIGPSQSGKTTLLNLIAAQAQEQEHISPDTIVVSLTIREDLKRSDAEKEFCESLGVTKRPALIKFLRGRRIIILLNDLGILSRDSRGMEVRHWLRGLSHNRTNGTTIQLVATSQRPLHEIFTQDKPIDCSPLHDSMRECIELGPFTRIEARRFIASRLQGTPFKERDFDAVLKGSLMPGELEKACRERYDALCQELEDA